MVHIQHLIPRDYHESNWSGGKTRELYLYPPDGDYKERQFDFRLSTASIEVTESHFTPLDGFQRILMTLDQEIQLHNRTQKNGTVLSAFQSYSFDGGDSLFCKGQCHDFNLIYQPTYQGKIKAVVPNQIIESTAQFQFIYALKAIRIQLCEESIYTLKEQELLVIEQNSQAKNMKLLFLPLQSSDQPSAIWTALRTLS
ncbi:hypothetical protein STRDD10_00967 [Streptococcus sp. DD10]|uniref:HutD family protein n=1 Tax=Streptococcus sp. DD10 TaxID=1777878 RepID=UPI000796B303|nr:HutD family protein [Streptococcus sp. DD10]KXT74380.1 hypothetical protein STRDD10_00967 [Streptococcus sp. DD10]